MAGDVIVVIGAGGIGMAIARRQGFGKTVLLADFNEKLLAAAAAELRNGSYRVEIQSVDGLPQLRPGPGGESWAAGQRHAPSAAVASTSRPSGSAAWASATATVPRPTGPPRSP